MYSGTGTRRQSREHSSKPSSLIPLSLKECSEGRSDHSLDRNSSETTYGWSQYHLDLSLFSVSLYIQRYSSYELWEYKSLNELNLTLSDPPTLTFELRPS